MAEPLLCGLECWSRKVVIVKAAAIKRLYLQAAEVGQLAHLVGEGPGRKSGFTASDEAAARTVVMAAARIVVVVAAESLSR